MKCGELVHTRKAYGKALVEMGQENPNLVVLDADLSSSTQTILFARKYPDRFFNVGCAEQNLIGVSAGLALGGKTVFASAFAMFGVGRAWEQIRNTIAYDNLDVKMVFTHAGLTVGKDGSSHQIIEDLALMRSIPGMKIQVPADPMETTELIKAAGKYRGPVYVRLTREKSPVLFEEYDHDLDKPVILSDGCDVSILACGYMVQEAVQAVSELKKKKIDAKLVNVHTIKPIHKDTILDCAKDTGAIVTCEEHSIFGGLGSAVSEVLAEQHPTPMKRIGIRDRFGKSGSASDLLEKYNLTRKDIVKAAEKLVKSR